jgi:hypothetical protein
LDLLIAGFVLFLLFVATYSQRRTWVALGSTALTVLLVGGGVVFTTAQVSTAQGPSQVHQVHDGLAQLAKSLPAGWDAPALKLTGAIEQASASLARTRTQTPAGEPRPVLTASVSDWFSFGSWFKAEPETEESAAPDGEPEAKAEPAADSGSDAPIKWVLDAPSPAAADETFAVRGANISDQPLKVVRAVLKPDTGAAKVRLKLKVDGHDGTAGAVIPPGARFRLEAAGLTASEAEAFGGAILSFAYVQAGRRKSSIMYLTPETLTASD